MGEGGRAKALRVARPGASFEPQMAPGLLQLLASPSPLIGCAAALLVGLLLGRWCRAKRDATGPAVFPHGPVEMQMPGHAHTFHAPDRTLMRVLWKEIYEDRCYDSTPLTPLKTLAADAKEAGRPVVVLDVGGNIGVFARIFAASCIFIGNP